MNLQRNTLRVCEEQSNLSTRGKKLVVSECHQSSMIFPDVKIGCKYNIVYCQSHSIGKRYSKSKCISVRFHGLVSRLSIFGCCINQQYQFPLTLSTRLESSSSTHRPRERQSPVELLYVKYLLKCKWVFS